ncbi:uncharacterized protein LOC134854904 [Symsagittifera roscoffensis]|uniref:uncharacterized protein LOC134854904 n=1 Tax=Symsagittifera roscoffensis TaxID=84072 RepID=UPI00307CC76C
MKAANSAQYIQKRAAQSDVKTEQRNKQVGSLTRRSQYRIEKDAEYGNGVYLKERTALLMDIKRLTIEYDFFKKQLNKENREKDPKKAEASFGQGPDSKKKKKGAKEDDIFKFLLPDGPEDNPSEKKGGDEEGEFDGDILDPRIKRLKLLQQEHEKQLQHRITVFYKDVDEDMRKLGLGLNKEEQRATRQRDSLNGWKKSVVITENIDEKK